jgi:hypothetical protein
MYAKALPLVPAAQCGVTVHEQLGAPEAIHAKPAAHMYSALAYYDNAGTIRLDHLFS